MVWFIIMKRWKAEPGRTDSLSSGSDPRLAIDHNDNPHVVYTTTDGKIAYISRSGSTWSETINIRSNNSGSYLETRYCC